MNTASSNETAENEQTVGEREQAKTADADATNHEEQDKQVQWRSDAEWTIFLNSFPGGIVLIVLASINWGKCQVIPSLQYQVLVFGTIHATLQLIKFFARTEKLLKEEVFNTWAKLDLTLGLCLVGLGIWGAILTFGNTDKAGSDPGECTGGLFWSGLAASALCLAIVVFVVIPIIIRDIWKGIKEENEKNQEQDGEEQGTSLDESNNV